MALFLGHNLQKNADVRALIPVIMLL